MNFVQNKFIINIGVLNVQRCKIERIGGVWQPRLADENGLHGNLG